MQQRGLDFHFVVTATTRPKREDEVEGRDYFFVSKEEFARMIEDDELLEYAVVYDDYKGVPREQVQKALESGKDVVMRVDVQGAETAKKKMGDVLMIFITAENGAELERRLRKRESETPEELALRIATARKELKRVDEFDYVVLNPDDQLEKTADIIQAIITAAHHKTPGRKTS
jgi:guanylate kinase